MITNNRYKKDFITSSGFALGGLWVSSIFIGIILVCVTSPFPFWWTILLALPINICLYIFHIIIVKRIQNGIDFELNNRKLKWLSLSQLLVLNLPLFAFGLIGSIFYTKTYYTL